MAKALEDKKNKLVAGVTVAKPSQSPAETVIEESSVQDVSVSTAEKIEGALEQITRSVANVGELIQENTSSEISPKESAEDIEKQLQELNSIISPNDPVAERADSQIKEASSLNSPAESEVDEIERQLQELNSIVKPEEPAANGTDPQGIQKDGVLDAAVEEAVGDLDKQIEELNSILKPEEVEPEVTAAAETIEETIQEDISNTVPARKDAEVEKTEELMPQNVSAGQDREETTPVANIEDLMKQAGAGDQPAQPQTPAESEKQPQIPEVVDKDQDQETANTASENRLKEVVEAFSQKTEYPRVLVAWHDRGGKVTEEYRSLRTNLLAKSRDDRFCLMITSAQAHEGKTVSCLNLAFVMAERVDHKTVVVDLNLRNGQMAKLLGARPGPGVADYLRGTADLHGILQPTAYPNLFFLPAGRIENHQPSELLGRSELKRLVGQLRKDFDYVLLDTPAANQFSDACVAGLATGEALLVVRSHKTTREAVTRAINGLQNANVNLVGILMTHWRDRFFN